MQYWKKDRNYRKYANADGSTRYVITVDGVDVEVAAEVYMAYAQADRRERYCYEREAGVLFSLERMAEDNRPLGYFTDKYVESAEDTVLWRMRIAAALHALSRLEPEERLLIESVVMGGITEQAYAARIGITQKAVNKRKSRALKKICKYFCDFGT